MDLLEQYDDLRGLCDPECNGRCKVCPQDWAREAKGEIERLRKIVDLAETRKHLTEQD